jgi:probable HAF family extracellular repeat protein
MWGFRTGAGSLSASSALWDVSEDGLVAVGEKDGYAMVIADSSSTPTVFGRGFASKANAVSADGSVIVGRSQVSGSSLEAFVRTPSGMIGLGDFANSFSVSSEATDVSPNGQIVVGKANIAGANSPWAGFRWTQSGGMVQLEKDFLPSAVTDAGMIVGNWGGHAYVIGSSLGDGYLEPLLEGCGVDLSGWNLVAYDVTPDGKTIVGYGVDSSYQYQAVLIRLP